MSTCYDCGQNDCSCVSPEVARLRQDLAEARAARDVAAISAERHQEGARYYREMAVERGKIMWAAEAEVARLRPVVEAAEAYVDQHGAFYRGLQAANSEIEAQIDRFPRHRLVAAVDAYRSSAPEPEEKP